MNKNRLVQTTLRSTSVISQVAPTAKHRHERELNCAGSHDERIISSRAWIVHSPPLISYTNNVLRNAPRFATVTAEL
jgi:hypothetical protein